MQRYSGGGRDTDRQGFFFDDLDEVNLSKILALLDVIIKLWS